MAISAAKITPRWYAHAILCTDDITHRLSLLKQSKFLLKRSP